MAPHRGDTLGRDTAEPSRAPEGPLAYAHANRSRFVAELEEFIRYPSISAQPEHAPDVHGCAEWLANHLADIGMERATVVPTRGHPLVYAEWRHQPARPTALIYGHYDVQPPEPLAEWRSPPFEATRRGNELYGRGASDDKGQLFTHVKALEAYLRVTGALPVNVTCLLEGEEEIGSPHLRPFLARHRDALGVDVAVLSDTSILGPDRPAITYALRGALSVEVKVEGPRRDLHAGRFGGAVHDPIQALCAIVSDLHDHEGRIAIPRFYDRVRPASPTERASMARVGPTDAEILDDAGTDRAWGEPGYTLYERTTLRPALSISGITGGYQGAGPKAAISASALAKLDFRLVPDQDPEEIAVLFRRHLARLTPPTVRVVLRTHFRARAVLVDRRHPALRAAAIAYRNAFGAAPVALRSGGTIPVVGALEDVLGITTVLMGFGLPDEARHAPNEKLHLPTFYQGIDTSIWFLAKLARLARAGA